MNQAHEKGLVHLVLGGARSGKTAFGMRLAEEAALEKWLIATAEPFDDEMKARIEQHRQERDHSWRIVEQPVDLVEALQSYAADDRVLVVDCLTIWLNNLILHNIEAKACITQLCEFIKRSTNKIILISNELGMGLAPETPLGRSFRDLHGKMNQDIAHACGKVTFVAAGLPIAMK